MPDVDARSDASFSDASEGDIVSAVVAAERVHALVDALRAVAAEHEAASQNAAETSSANEGAMRARARARRVRYARACRDLTAAIDDDRACAEEASRANARAAVEAFGDADADESARDARTAAVAACERITVERYKTCMFHGVEVRVLETALANGVGARLWNAARTLSRRLARAPETVRGKTVLEVGAGVGTCGILAAKLGARSVTLSDYEEPLLEALDRSVVENGCAETCSAVALDWNRELARAPTPTTDPKRALADDQVFDVIIGSDVLYEREHVRALPACVARRLAPDGECWLVNASRYAGMFEELVDALRACHLRVDVIHDDDTDTDVVDASTRATKVKAWHDGAEKTIRVSRAPRPERDAQ